jgi:hypothetical protein
MAEAHGTARVLITSIDGNVTHPFRWDQVADDVRRFGYDQLVNDKGQISFDNTWIEHDGVRLDGGTKLSAFGDPSKQPGNVPDLTMNLAWTQQGGNI